jgi:hypothetical protein
VDDGQENANRLNLSEVGSDAYAFAEALPGGLQVKRRLPSAGERSTAVGGYHHTGRQLSGDDFVFWDEKKIPCAAGVRGSINGMSEDSKRRLTRKLMRVPWASFTGPKNADVVSGLFLTLTYPGEYSEAWQNWKSHLDKFIRRLKRRCPILGIVWKLEFQRRGAPHFHMVLLFSRPVVVKVFRHWCASAWYQCVGSGDERHLRAGTEAHGLYIPGDGGGTARLMQYLCKYISKEVDTLEIEGTGRVWGWRGEVPVLSFGVVSMTRFEYECFLHCVRQWNPNSRFLSTMSSLQNAYNVFGDGAVMCGFFEVSGVCVDPDV